MDTLLEQFDIILDGVRWQLIICVLGAAAVTETMKSIPWVSDAEIAIRKKRVKATGWQRTVVWAINGLLPESICVAACLLIPGVLPPEVTPGVAVFVGYLSGTLSSKLHTLFLAKLLAKFGLSQKEEEA